MYRAGSPTQSVDWRVYNGGLLAIVLVEKGLSFKVSFEHIVSYITNINQLQQYELLFLHKVLGLCDSKNVNSDPTILPPKAAIPL